MDIDRISAAAQRDEQCLDAGVINSLRRVVARHAKADETRSGKERGIRRSVARVVDIDGIDASADDRELATDCVDVSGGGKCGTADIDDVRSAPCVDECVSRECTQIECVVVRPTVKC